MTATLVARADNETRNHMSFVDYHDADGNVHPVSALSLVVLSAKNSNQIRTARLEAIRAGLPYADFTQSMTKDTFVEQIHRTRAWLNEDADYGGVCIFGLKEAVDTITLKFSLWRISPPTPQRCPPRPVGRLALHWPIPALDAVQTEFNVGQPWRSAGPGLVCLA